MKYLKNFSDHSLYEAYIVGYVSSGDWVDRIQNHILYKRGNPIKLNNNLVEVSLNNFYARQYDVELLLGDIWEIEIKFIILVIPDKYSNIL